jgi:hypothetical protein
MSTILALDPDTSHTAVNFEFTKVISLGWVAPMRLRQTILVTQFSCRWQTSRVTDSL